MFAVFLPVPTSVCDPVAVTSAVSSFTRPVIVASLSVSADPSYALLALPVVTVTGALLTVRVPLISAIFLKFEVLSSPAAFLIT